MSRSTGAGGEPAVTIRDAVAGDAAGIAALGREFCDYLRALGDPAPAEPDAETLLRDGFGPGAAFHALVAELDGELVGYLLHCPWYDLDAGGRVLYVASLFVTAGARGRGAGRALMDAVTGIARDRGAASVAWTVYGPNRLARRFYEGIGAEAADDLTLMHLPV